MQESNSLILPYQDHLWPGMPGCEAHTIQILQHELDSRKGWNFCESISTTLILSRSSDGESLAIQFCLPSQLSGLLVEKTKLGSSKRYNNVIYPGWRTQKKFDSGSGWALRLSQYLSNPPFGRGGCPHNFQSPLPSPACSWHPALPSPLETNAKHNYAQVKQFAKCWALSCLEVAALQRLVESPFDLSNWCPLVQPTSHWGVLRH